MGKYVKTWITCLSVLSLTCISISSAFQKEYAGKALIREVEEPTPVQEGVMSEKQKKHSKIFKGYDWFSNGKKIKDLVAEKRGDVEISAPVKTTILRHAPALTAYLQKLTCDADAVIIGTVENKTSHLIESGSFVFTDYGITAREVLKNNDAAPIRQGDEITVTRAGGAIKLNNHVVRATDPGMRNLKTGETYLLYLKFIPETGAYRPFGNSLSEDTFRLRGDKATQVSRKRWPFGRPADEDAYFLLSEARNALNSACKPAGAN